MIAAPARTIRLDEATHRTDAPNGLVVVTERLPAVRSAAAGVWVQTASGHEDRGVMGVSHLLEHLVFKGTERRTAKEIATSLEARGGSLDAYTSRDHTAFQAHVLDADLPLALDVLTDIVRHPVLRDADLELERNVVLEEINGVQDDPGDLVGELWSAALWPDHAYGRSILGTPDSVNAITTADLRRVHADGYYPGNSVIAVAGNIEHDEVLALLGELGWFEGEARAPLDPALPATAVQGVERIEHRDSQQVHAIAGTGTVDARDPRRWGLALLSAALGGGMSSRLFQRIREELGLCYAIQSWHVTHRAAGVFGIYLGTQPATAARAFDAMHEELRRVANEGLPLDELNDAKGQVSGSIVLGLESTVGRMSRLAGHVLNNDRYRSIDEVLTLINAVTPAETAELAATFLQPERMTTVRLGPTH